MPSNIVLLGWEAKNLRCPDHKLSLIKSGTASVYPVTLLQMPNGTGKTTTLTLLRATLSGAAADWPPDTVREFQKKAARTKHGQFIVRLALDRNLITFELTLDFEDGKALYRTTFGAGVQKGFRPPPPLRRFLSAEFVDLFVFDGELATRLLDNSETKARSAIDALFQLPLLAQLASKIEKNWKDHADTVSVKQEKGLTQRRNRLSSLEQSLHNLKKRRKQLTTKIPLLQKELEAQEAKYLATLGKDDKTRQQLEDLNEKKRVLDGKIESLAARVVEHLRDPHALLLEFAVEMTALKQNMDRLKLPRSTSREFFEELSREEYCICARALDETARTAILERSQGFLAADEVGALNQIKSDITTHCGDDLEASKVQLDAAIAELSSHTIARDEVIAELQAVEAERLSQGNGQLDAAKKQIEDKKKLLDSLTEELDEIDSTPDGSEDDDTCCLKALELKKAQAKQAVAEATNTVTLRKKTEILSAILSDAQMAARGALKRTIIEETNQRLQKMLLREPVELADVEDCLMLKDQAGASAGQTLAVSYAFLATLFGRGDYQLPFIVDSPAGPLDLNVRPEVARIVPKLCKQFIAFTISSEREKFVGPLDKAVSGAVQYLTLYRTSADTKTLCKGIAKTAVESFVDGTLVMGREFFDRFDVKED
jgi:DNA sulfur modification protein DndD